MKREPAVAHQFYPGDPATLRRTLERLIPETATKLKALAVVSPHAGYIYSGAVAGETFAAVEIPRDIVVMGPNHHGYGPQVSLMNKGTWTVAPVSIVAGFVPERVESPLKPGSV